MTNVRINKGPQRLRLVFKVGGNCAFYFLSNELFGLQRG
jgi:hypothetical protein